MVPTAVVVRTHIRRLPGEEGLAVLAAAFGRREDADTDSPGLPVGIGPGEAESESSLADGSHGVGRLGLGPAVGLAPGVLPVRSGDSCLVVAGAEWMAGYRCRIAEDRAAVDLELVVADSCLEADVVRLLLEEMCKLVEERDQGLLALRLRSQWRSSVASMSVSR